MQKYTKNIVIIACTLISPQLQGGGDGELFTNGIKQYETFQEWFFPHSALIALRSIQVVTLIGFFFPFYC